MRAIKRINELFLYFVIIVSGYLVLSLWYYISNFISSELKATGQMIISLVNTFILVVLLSLMVYLILKLIRRFY